MNDIIKKNIKWIFVSGKGGVGKTTTSASISTILSKYKKDVLLISTDPAHSLSDIFNQQFTNEPILINNFTNLYCMEYNSDIYLQEKTYKLLNDEFKDFKELQKLFLNIPGIDEAMGYITLMNLVLKYDYSTIVFDTAPTGNTLKLLAYPSLILNTIQTLYKSKLGTVLQGFIKMIYNVGNNIEDKMDKISKNISHLNSKLTNPDFTTFISVMIPEFLSVWETERLIQTLYKFNIDCDTIIINQIITEDDNIICNFLKKRKQMQQKYIDMIYDLYNDESEDELEFTIIKVPLLDEEIRYTKNISNFANAYFDNYIHNDLSVMNLILDNPDNDNDTTLVAESLINL